MGRAMSEAEYLELDANSAERHEYFDGDVVAMAGSDPVHGAVVGQLACVLRGGASERLCLFWTHSQRVRVEETGAYAYPDLVATCGRPELAPTRPPTLLNPLLIVEVLSPSTEADDRGAKFAHYQRRASLREYVLVTPGERRVEVFTRMDDGAWSYRAYTGDEVVPFASLGIEVPLPEIYAQAELLRELTS